MFSYGEERVKFWARVFGFITPETPNALSVNQYWLGGVGKDFSYAKTPLSLRI